MLPDFTFAGSNKVSTSPQLSTPNVRISLSELVDLIRSTPPGELGRIRATIKTELTKGTPWKEIKPLIRADKENLPYVLFSGFCPIHHNDKTLKYNGFIQVDIDFKHVGGDLLALEVKNDLKRIEYVALAAVSPSGHGVKALVSTSNLDINKHGHAAKQVFKDLAGRLELEEKYFDKLGASQPCFIPYDKDVYYNEDFDRFEVTEQPEIEEFERVAHSINETDAFKFADAFARLKGYEMTDGQKHLYVTYFSIAANLLGLSQDETGNYIIATYPGVSIRSNALSYPFKKYRESAGLWSYKLREQAANIITGHAGQKCSDLLAGVGSENKIVIAPTGSGKTYYVSRLHGFKVIACPTTALVDNICKEYGAYKFAGRKNRATYEGLKDAEFIVTTYASFKKLTAALKDLKRIDSFRLFIDESHNFTTSSNPAFMLDQLREVLELKNEYKAFTLLTGTDVFTAVPELVELEKIEVRIPKARRPAYLIEAKNTTKAAAMAFTRSIERGRFPILLFDNASEAGRLGTLKALIDRNDVEYFNSGTKDAESWQSLVSSGSLPAGLEGFTTTSVLKEGNNIYDKKDFDIIILGNVHHSTIEQFAKRARNPKTLAIHIIKSQKRERSEKWFIPGRYAAYLEKKTAAVVDELNTPGECSEEEQAREFLCRQHMQVMPIRLKNGVYEIDYLRLSNMVYTAETAAENRNDELFRANLAKYNIHLSAGIAKVKDDYTAAEKGRIKKTRKEKREELEKEYTECLEKLSGAACALTYATNMLDGDKCLSKAENLAYKWFVKFTEYIKHAGPILEVLEATGPNNAKIHLEYKRLVTKELIENAAYMETNRKFVIVLKAIKSKFRAGQRLTSEQIKHKLIECLSLDKSFDLEQLEQERNAKTLNILRMFFELEKKRERDGERLYYVYTLKALDFKYLKKKRPEKMFPYFSVNYINILQNRGTTTRANLGYPASWDM